MRMQMARIESTRRSCQATGIDLNIVASERPHHFTGMRKSQFEGLAETA